jgi:uncharacterized Zn-binding protein involved in type VI secretion
MHGVARRHLDTAAGLQIGVGQTWITVEDQLWIILGDVNTPHMPRPHTPGGDNMVQGSSWISIDGIPVCREGHLAGCGHPTTGSQFMFLSD